MEDPSFPLRQLSSGSGSERLLLRRGEINTRTASNRARKNRRVSSNARAMIGLKPEARDRDVNNDLDVDIPRPSVTSSVPSPIANEFAHEDVFHSVETAPPLQHTVSQMYPCLTSNFSSEVHHPSPSFQLFNKFVFICIGCHHKQPYFRINTPMPWHSLHYSQTALSHCSSCKNIASDIEISDAPASF